MKLKNKVCVITGSTRGIGYGIALSFLKEGAKVAIVGTREESANKAVEALKKEVPKATLMGVAINVGDTSSVETGFKKVYDNFGKIDVLVNNAGITLTRSLPEVTDSEFEKLINTNLGGAFRCSREVLKYMPKDGSIINTSSMNGVYGAPNQSIYSAAKAGIIGLTKSLAKELGPKNIRVNAIAPGMVETDMVKEFVNDNMRNMLINMTPLRRISTPDDLAGAYTFLASDDASFITGVVISVDGGLVL